MEVKDIQPNQGSIDLVLEVVSKEEPRTFSKFGKEGQVCNAKVQDGSGQVTLTLWNDDVEKVSVGDKIHLQNGWCSEYRGEKQLSSGKFGKIEILESQPAEVLTNDPAILGQEAPGADEEQPELVQDEELVE